MLGGISPVLIVNLKTFNDTMLGSLLTSVPLVGSVFEVGIPVPIYLDERLTGIVVDNENRAINIDTEVTATKVVKGQINEKLIKQQGVDSDVTLALVAHKDSIFLSALLALMDQIVERVTTDAYSITYMNGATVIFNALLKGVQVSAHRDDDLLSISISLLRTSGKAPNQPPGGFQVKNTTGTGLIPPGI